VGELGTFRLAGGTRGVEDDRGVVRPPFHHAGIRTRCREHDVGEGARIDGDRIRVGLLRARPRLVRAALPDEHQPGAGVAEVVRDLPGLE
jgi:hypothetical protein